MHVASDCGNNEIIQLLMEHGSPCNIQSGGGHTPLFLACCNGHDCTVDLLLEAGADLHAKDQAMKTPLHFACHNKHVSIVRKLLDHVAAKEGLEVARELVQTADSTGYQPVHSATLGGNLEIGK